MVARAQFAKMNGLGNEIIVADMRGRTDKVSAQAAAALNADPATGFDQIMAIHDARTEGTAYFVEILNCDGSTAQACGNGMRCVVQALASETGEKTFTFETVAGIINAEEHADGLISVDLEATLCLAGHSTGGGVSRYPRHRIADRTDRCAGSAFAVGRVDGQPARHLLGRP